MANYQIKPFFILVSCCFLIGLVIEHFTALYWPTAGLLLLAFLMFMGLMADADSNCEGGLDYDPNESEESKRSHKTLVRIHAFVMIMAFCMAIFIAVVKYS
jgi:hypothetical protein